MKQPFLWVLIAYLCWVPSTLIAQQIGSIEGIVLDEATGVPIADVTVILSATGQRIATDQDGTFALKVPLGTHNINIRFPFYLTQTVSGIEVNESQPKQTLRVVLTPQVIKLGPIHLPVRLSESSETGLLEKRRLSFAVEDSISTELMAKLPVSDAGEALKRVTGISIVGGRYVFVRGLGERYSNTLLNSVQIPSPEPNRRVVPMDIFPANLLESLQTVKTFSPDQPGNFAGGSVQVFTKDFPDAFTMSLSMSSSFNTETTGKELLEYPGGTLDRFGFDDGTRALPDIIADQPPEVPIRERGRFTRGGFTPEEIQKFGRAFDNVWSPERYTAPANQSHKFSIGNSTQLAGKDFGYLGIISYGNGHSHRPEEEQNAFRLGLDELTPVTKYLVERSANDVSWGGVLSTSMRFSPGHKVSLRTLYSHTAEDETRTWEGFNADRDTDMRSSRLLYVERGLLSSQLAGDHEFDFSSDNLDGESEAAEESDTSEPEFAPVPTLSWRLTFSRAMRNEPDTREVIYEKRRDEWLFRDITQSGSRFFFDLADDEISGRLDWSMPILTTGLFKVGGMWRDRDRTFDARRFRFLPSDNIELFLDRTAPPEQLFTAEHIAPNLFELRESTRATDNYLAAHSVWASYGMIDLPLSKKFRVTTGARLEVSDQNVTTFDPFAAEQQAIEANLDTTDILPSLNLTYRLTERMNLRVAASRTVTRPDLRELAPFEFTDFVGGRTIFGNPELERTKIDNYDLRWEAFPELGGVVAVSGFYKKFHKPIEQIIQPAAEVRITYENAEAANNFGLELEVRQNLSILASGLRHFSVNTNVALISSRVELPDVGIQTSSERALQGQSPYVVNASLGYDNPDLEMTAAVAYHVFGKRIAEVGNHGSPDVFELPRSQLDMTFGRQLLPFLRLSLSAKNLLNPDVTLEQGGETYVRYRTGRTISFGLSYNL
ncbi:TonB-dependent receptor [Candidatus Poribacteria bacterium]|nr:TonB-dependent receptor [Candidatus Poribacteria bacterium]